MSLLGTVSSWKMRVIVAAVCVALAALLVVLASYTPPAAPAPQPEQAVLLAVLERHPACRDLFLDVREDDGSCRIRACTTPEWIGHESFDCATAVIAHGIPTSNGRSGVYTMVIVPILKVDGEWTAACSVSVDNRDLTDQGVVVKAVAISDGHRRRPSSEVIVGHQAELPLENTGPRRGGQAKHRKW